MKKLLSKAIIAAILFNIPGVGFYQAWAGAMSLKGAPSVKSVPAQAALSPALNLPVSYQFEDVYFKLAGQQGQIYRVPIFQPQTPGQERPASIQQAHDLSQAVADIASDQDRSPEALQASLNTAWKEKASGEALNLGASVRAPPSASAANVSQTIEVKAQAPVSQKAVPQISRSKQASVQPPVLSQVRSAADAALGLAGQMVQRFTGAATRLLTGPKSLAAAVTLASMLFLMPLPSQAGKLDLAPNDTAASSSAPTSHRRTDLEPNEWRVKGNFSFYQRLEGPKFAGDETKLQHNMYKYLQLTFTGRPGGIPVLAEFWIPPNTGSATPELRRLAMDLVGPGSSLLPSRHFIATLGLFHVPLGLQKDYSMGAENTLISGPLQWATHRNQDLILRLNSPRPLMGADYTDLGVKMILQDINIASQLALKELAFAVITGPKEANIRTNRAFVGPLTLQVQGPGAEGVWLDTEGNAPHPFSDNNNNKTVVGRMNLGVGEKVEFGASALNGYYDLEAQLRNTIFTGHLIVTPAPDWKFTGEAVASETGIKVPVMDAAGAVSLGTNAALLERMEKQRGYSLQIDFPVLRQLRLPASPWWAERSLGKLLGAFAFNRLTSDAPEFTFSSNSNPNTSLPFRAMRADAGNIRTSITKFSGGLAWVVNPHFTIRYNRNHWILNVPSVHGAPQSDIYDDIFSFTLRFESNPFKIFSSRENKK